MLRNYLFLIENNEVRVFKYIPEINEFEHIKNRGEDIVKLSSNSEDFWNWWEKKVSFIYNDKVDFCFIYDKEYEITKNISYENNEYTVWDKRVIEQFFYNKPEYRHIEVHSISEKQISIDKSNIEFSDNSLKIFFTNIEFRTNKKNKNSPCSVSPMYKYYTDRLESEKKN